MDKELLSIRMVMFIWGSEIMTCDMGLVPINLRMGLNIKVNGPMMTFMAREPI